MKILLPFLIVALVTNFVFAQTENYKATAENFQQNYNADQYDEIFNCFSPEMKKALPVEKTKEFLSNLKIKGGKIESMEFTSYQQETYALYKTKFEKAILAVNLSLDKQNQINGFFIKPYEAPKVNENKTINALSSYPKEIAEVIFAKSKDLPNHAQLSIAIIQNGRTSYYGIKKINDTIKPAENEKFIFEIGSITKVFTSTVLASLAEDQKIKLTDEINSYYPFAFHNKLRLTFESLANHTSGLPRLPENLDLSNDINPYKHYGKTEIEAYLKSFVEVKNEQPRTYSYSNIGAGLLGYTLGLSQKTTFQQLLQERIFDK